MIQMYVVCGAGLECWLDLALWVGMVHGMKGQSRVCAPCSVFARLALHAGSRVGAQGQSSGACMQYAPHADSVLCAMCVASLALCTASSMCWPCSGVHCVWHRDWHALHAALDQAYALHTVQGARMARAAQGTGPDEFATPVLK